MSGIEIHSQNVNTDVKHLASQILSVFPELEPDSRRTAVQLYRLLGEGDLVSRDALAKAAGISLDRVNEILEGWSGIYYEGEKIVGFWGLTPKPFSKHLLKYRDNAWAPANASPRVSDGENRLLGQLRQSFIIFAYAKARSSRTIPATGIYNPAIAPAD